DVRLHGLWLLRIGHWRGLLSQWQSVPVADAGADDLRGGLPDAAARRSRARAVRRQTRPARRARVDAEPHVNRHSVHRVRAWLRVDRPGRAAPRTHRTTAAGIFGGHGTWWRIGVPLGDRHTRTKRLLCQLAVCQPAGGGRVRGAARRAAERRALAVGDEPLGLARAAARRL